MRSFLKELHDTLVLNNKIIDNDSFSALFKTYEDFPKNPIEWKTSPNQLMYLLYLIFKKQKQFHGYQLDDIACRIFKKSVGNFNKKSLNTILNQVIKNINDKKPLSSNLEIIKNIFDDLKLV